MREIAAADFKARCLRLMDEVRVTREPILIRKKGRPVAQLVPVEEKAPEVFGCLAGVIEVSGDLVAPAVPADAWETAG